MHTAVLFSRGSSVLLMSQEVVTFVIPAKSQFQPIVQIWQSKRGLSTIRLLSYKAPEPNAAEKAWTIWWQSPRGTSGLWLASSYLCQNFCSISWFQGWHCSIISSSHCLHHYNTPPHPQNTHTHKEISRLIPKTNLGIYAWSCLY